MSKSDELLADEASAAAAFFVAGEDAGFIEQLPEGLGRNLQSVLILRGDPLADLVSQVGK